MNIVKPVATVLGVLLLLMGLLWIGQGLNIVKWPASSFMIGDPEWSWRGIVLAIVGAAMIWWGRRRIA